MIGALGVITYQDFKDRKVTALLFLVLGCIGATLFYQTQFLEAFGISIGINLIFIAVLSVVLLSYIRFKMKIKVSQAMGFGDFFFFLALAVSFPTITFLVLFSCSLIFSLLLFLILKPRLKIKTVPLAGLQALFLNLIFVFNWFFNLINLYAM